MDESKKNPNVSSHQKRRIDIGARKKLDLKSGLDMKRINTTYKKVTSKVNQTISSPKKQINKLLPQSTKNSKYSHFLLPAILLLIVGLVLFTTLNVIPQKHELREGMIGQPRYINPLLSLANEVDASIDKLIYPRLFFFNAQEAYEKDLVESVNVENNGKDYIISIKPNIVWEDQKPLTADDIIFTLKLIQDPAFKSPLLPSFSGVGIEKLETHKLKLSLKNSYSPFLSSLTFGILPKHVWENVSSANFQLAELNTKPVGAGPYKFSSLKKDKKGNITSYSLDQNNNYYNKKPSLERIIFSFYTSEPEIVKAYNRNKIDSFSELKTSSQEVKNVNVYDVKTPRYFALFFNTQNNLFKFSEIRQALSQAIDKKSIIENSLSGQGISLNGPLTPVNTYYKDIPSTFNIDQAKKILDDNNWKDIDGDGVREKNNVRTEFTLLTSQSDETEKVVIQLQKDAAAIGIKMNFTVLPFSELQQKHIKDRSYDAVFVGEALNIYPDPYVFWHSSQVKDPGLNLSLYANTQNDLALEAARTTVDEAAVQSNLEKFQNQIVADAPAIFMYSPFSRYYIRNSFTGIEIDKGNTPGDRFNNISNWNIKNNSFLNLKIPNFNIFKK